MRKFFTKKLAVAFTVSALAAVQVTGVAASVFSDVVVNYATASDTTASDTTASDTTMSDTTSTDTTPSDTNKKEDETKPSTGNGNNENVSTPSGTDNDAGSITQPDGENSGSISQPDAGNKKDDEVTTPSDTNKKEDETKPSTGNGNNENVSRPSGTDNDAGSITQPDGENSGSISQPDPGNKKDDEVTTPSDTDKKDEITTPSDTDKKDEVTTPSDTNKKDDVATPSDTTPSDTTSTDTTPSDTTGTDASGDDNGYYSKPSYVSDSNIVSVDEINKVLENAVANTTDSSVTVATKGQAPVLSADLFAKIKAANKDVTVSVTDANNNLMYSWTFAAVTLGNADKDVDLSLAFATDKAAAIEKLAGTNEMFYLSFNYHGELPGPATLHTYVGNAYQNGDILYLYYYNEELGRIETVGNNDKLEVKDGYVDFTIEHCSVYFLSTHTADEVNAVNPATGEKINNTIDTGDRSNVMFYVLLSVLAAAGILTVAVVERRKAK